MFSDDLSVEAFVLAHLSLDQRQYVDLHSIPSYRGSESREQGAVLSREPFRAAWPPKSSNVYPNGTQYVRDLTSDLDSHRGESLAVGPGRQQPQARHPHTSPPDRRDHRNRPQSPAAARPRLLGEAAA
eukprot:4678530-Pyramimonas_sp.AAC.1